jgi:hypothetical protein
LLVKGLEVLRAARDNLFGLSFGQVRPRVLVDLRDQVVKGVLARGFDGSPPDTVPVAFQRQIERGVERMQALNPAVSVAGAHDGDRADKRFDFASLETLMSSLFEIGADDRRVDGGRRDAFIDVGLQQKPQDLKAISQNQVFQLMERPVLRRFGLQFGHKLIELVPSSLIKRWGCWRPGRGDDICSSRHRGRFFRV